MSEPETGAVAAGGRLAALRHPHFTLFWVCTIVSRIGTQMRDVAIAWHLYLLTHSALSLGLVGAARVAPIVVLSLGGGVAADAFDRRRIMMFTQTLMALASSALAFVTWRGLAHPAILYVLIGVGGAATAFDAPARQTLVTNLLPREDLENGLALNVLGFQMSTAVGPALGGFLLGVTGVGTLYALDAASYVALLAALVIVRPRADATAIRVGGVRVAALGEALRFLKTEPVIIWLMLLDFSATFLAGAMQLMPIFATEVFHMGASGLGWLYAAFPIGALVASAVLAYRPPIRAQGATVLVSIGVYGAAIAAFGAAPSLAIGLVAQALAGAADTVSTVIRQVVRQTHTPDQLRGRMTGVNMMFFIGGPQLGEVEAGAVAELAGARASVISGGLACVAIAAFAAAIAPVVRRLRLEPPQPKAS